MTVEGNTAAVDRLVSVTNENGASDTIDIRRVYSDAHPQNARSIRVLDSSNVKIVDCDVTSTAAAHGNGGTGDNIALSQVTDYLIQGCTVCASGDQGIVVENGSDRGRVVDNEVRACDASGIAIAAGAGSAPTRVVVADNTVEGCVIDRTGGGFTYHGGIALKGGVTDAKISANDSYNNGDADTSGYGISYDNGGSSDYNNIIGNNFRGNQTGAEENTAGANTQKAANVL